MASKSVGQRDRTHQDLIEALNRLLGSVEAQSRAAKVETEITHATKSFETFWAKHEAVTTGLEDSEAPPHEALLRSAQDAFDKATAKARAYLSTPSAAMNSRDASVASHKSRTPSQKRSSNKTSSSKRFAAQLRLQQIQESNAAADELAAVELRLAKEKAERQFAENLAKFDAMLEGESTDDEKSVVSTTNRVDTWVDSAVAVANAAPPVCSVCT